jgi:tetratricopeptide (TPR) repeat protein
VSSAAPEGSHSSARAAEVGDARIDELENQFKTTGLDTDARDELIRLYVASNRFADAIPLLEKALQTAEAQAGSEPADTQARALRRQLAVARMLTGDLKGAVELLERAARMAAETEFEPQAERAVAFAYLIDGRTDDAIDRARRQARRHSIDEYRAWHEARTTLAKALLFDGQDQQAIDILRDDAATAEQQRLGPNTVREAKQDLAAAERLVADLGRMETPEQVRQARRMSVLEELALLAGQPTGLWWIRADPSRESMPIGVPDTAPRFFVGPVTSEIDPKGSPDRLGVDLDARALAALVASRAMKPPLAIGVYGQWGSGKTFFMRRIEYWTRVLEATPEEGPDPVFEHGVAHIWFNAWHYAAGDSDANLWATLVSHIFTRLHTTPSEREREIAHVLNEVDTALAHQQKLHGKLDAAKKDAETTTLEVKAAHQKVDEARDKAAKLTLLDFIKAAKTVDQKTLDQFDDAATMLGVKPAGESLNDVADRAREVVELGRRATVLATAGRWYLSPLFLSLLVLGVVGLGGSVALLLARSAPGAQAAQFTAVFLAAAAWIGRQAALTRQILKPAEALQRSINERIQATIAQPQHELATAKQKHSRAAAKVARLITECAEVDVKVNNAEVQRDSLDGQVLLRRFLEKRASSADYDRYKGVVALAHHDLELLNEYLSEAVKESAGKKDLRRVVLYIDDLDRCDADTVATVLAAVHLLLALPLFTVIVGVDPHWLETSLQHAHTDLFPPEPEPTADSRDHHRRDHLGATTADYLQKIFQLTYTLPPMTAEACKALISASLQDALRLTDHPTSQPTSPTPSTTPTAPDYDSATEPQQGQLPQMADTALTGRAAFDELFRRQTRRKPLANALTLNKFDMAAITEVAPLVSTTPRRAKRFLSTYLVIRARAFAEMRTHADAAADAPALLMLVALMVGVPAAIPLLNTTQAGSGLNIDAWLDQLLEHDALHPDEASRLRSFRHSATNLASVPLDDVLKWRHLAGPYASSGSAR